MPLWDWPAVQGSRRERRRRMELRARQQGEYRRPAWRDAAPAFVGTAVGVAVVGGAVAWLG
ncbi:MAG: hypothetical protein HOV68_02130, partial [Streptomycetaceae bacterium]|nr:hypothetical protein [Streptomycetaceae bacterium]